MFDEFTGELPGMQPEDDLMEALGDVSEATKSAVVNRTAEVAAQSVPALQVASPAQVGMQVAQAVNQVAARSGIVTPLTQEVVRATTGMVLQAASRSGEAPALPAPVDGAPGSMKAIAQAGSGDEVVYQDGSLYAGQIGGIFRKSMFEGVR